MTGEGVSALAGTDRSSIFGLLRYIPLSLIAPRRTAREFVNEPRLQLSSWTLIVGFSLFSALAAIVHEWLVAGKKSSDALLPSLNIEVTAVSLAGYFVVIAVINLLGFMLARFLWKQLFLFFEQDNRVMAALAMSAAVGILMDPISTGADLLLDDTQGLGPRDLLIAVYLVASLAYGATYFSEALSIGWIRAFLTEFAVFLMVVICLGIPIIVAMFIINPDFATGVAPDSWTEVNSQIRQWIIPEKAHEQV